MVIDKQESIGQVGAALPKVTIVRGWRSEASVDAFPSVVWRCARERFCLASVAKLKFKGARSLYARLADGIAHISIRIYTSPPNRDVTAKFRS